METLTLRVTGMTCGGCENAVKRALARLDGVGDVTASHAHQQVGVTYDAGRVTPEQITAKIAAAGYTVPGAR
jgi:copper chaperone